MSLYDEIMRSWAVEALAATSLLMVVVLLARGPAQRIFGARVAYALWALPALRMMLPRVPGWDANHFHVEMDVPGLIHGLAAGAGPAPAMAAAAPPEAIPAALDAAPVAASLVDPAMTAGPVATPMDVIGSAAASVDWAFWLAALWLGGAALHLGWHMLAHRRFLRRIKADAVMLRRDCGISIYTGPAVPGPLATGLLHRAILLPADFTDRYSPRERRLVLAHEVAHHCRGDLFANAVALVVLSLNWFNPLAHRAYRLFRADQELACDETVLAHEAEDARFHYGQAIVKSVAPRFPAAACAMHSAGLLKRRLRMMTRMSGGAFRLLAGAMLGVAVVGAGLAATASGGAAAAEAAPPAPPVPPVPPVPPAAPDAPAAIPAVPAPPAPPAAARLRGSGHHHIIIADDRMTVDGVPVDPGSPQGRALRRQADEARRGAEDSLRRAADAQRNAEIARRDADREMARARREADRARAEALREAEQARGQALRDADRARRDALREAEQARREGLRAGEEARRAGEAAAIAARHAARAEVDGIVRASFASAQAALASACPERAASIANEAASLSRLVATCIDSAAIRKEVARSLSRARADVLRADSISDAERDRALSAIDRAIEHNRDFQ